jgi:hypothetical protein
VDVEQLAPGLWRWSAPHPAWKPENDRPGGWGQIVGCVYLEPPADAADAVVLIDPQAPPEGSPDAERFWKALDADVKKLGLPVVVLLGNESHGRSSQRIVERYAAQGTSIWALPAAVGKASCTVTRTFEPGDELPCGVEALHVEGMDAAEVVYWIPRHATLALADAVIGAGEGKLRVAPRSWSPDGTAYDERFRASLRRMLDLPIERVLVGHGASVTTGGREALRDALDAPEWGKG